MPEKVVPGPVNGDRRIREAVCIHTKKIMDSCKDKDCIEDLRVCLTAHSQSVLEEADCVRPGEAELIYADVSVEPIRFNRGCYTVDVRYYYRITADAYIGSCTRPVELVGVTAFSKRAVLCGGEGGAKVFTSVPRDCDPGCPVPQTTGAPVAVVESVDPMILDLKLLDPRDCCDHRWDCGGVPEIPRHIVCSFDDELSLTGEGRRMLVTLGQFSMIRLERDTQLLIPAYDYCVPTKDCSCGDDHHPDPDPCDTFRKVQFPVDAFFPSGCGEGCGCDCDCGCRENKNACR